MMLPSRVRRQTIVRGCRPVNYENKGCCWVIDQQNFDKQRFEELLIKLSVKKDEYLTKKINLEKLNYKNTWNNVNQKLLEIFNEN